MGSKHTSRYGHEPHAKRDPRLLTYVKERRTKKKKTEKSDRLSVAARDHTRMKEIKIKC